MAEDISLDDLEEAQRILEHKALMEIRKWEGAELNLQKKIDGLNSNLQKHLSGINDKFDHLTNAAEAILLQILKMNKRKGAEYDLCSAKSQFQPELPPSLPLQPTCPIEADYFFENNSEREECKVFDEMLNSEIKVVCEGEMTETEVAIGVEDSEDDNEITKEGSNWIASDLKKTEVAIGVENSEDDNEITKEGSNWIASDFKKLDVIGVSRRKVDVEFKHDSYTIIRVEKGSELEVGKHVKVIGFSKDKIILDEQKVFDRVPLPEMRFCSRKRAIPIAVRPLPKPPPPQWHLKNVIESVKRALSMSSCSIQFVHPNMSLYDAANDAKECEKAWEIGNSVVDHATDKYEIQRTFTTDAEVSHAQSLMKNLGNKEQMFRFIPIMRTMELRLVQARRPNEIKNVAKTSEQRRDKINVKVDTTPLRIQKSKSLHLENDGINNTNNNKDLGLGSYLCLLDFGCSTYKRLEESKFRQSDHDCEYLEAEMIMDYFFLVNIHLCDDSSQDKSEFQATMPHLTHFDDQNVIIAAHNRVFKKAGRCWLTFGSLGTELDTSANLVSVVADVVEELSLKLSGSVTVYAVETSGDEVAARKLLAMMDDDFQCLGFNSYSSVVNETSLRGSNTRMVQTLRLCLRLMTLNGKNTMVGNVQFSALIAMNLNQILNDFPWVFLLKEEDISSSMEKALLFGVDELENDMSNFTGMCSEIGYLAGAKWIFDETNNDFGCIVQNYQFLVINFSTSSFIIVSLKESIFENGGLELKKNFSAKELGIAMLVRPPPKPPPHVLQMSLEDKTLSTREYCHEHKY